MLKFKDLSDEEKTKRGILGTLFGPIASVVKSTRNGRKYPDEVWEKAFNDPLVKEMLAAGGIPGELDHPTDRSETCSEKIAIMMPEAPKKDKDGHLVARFDIIDTPMGRIAAALVKYGFKFGISSRGSGDTFTDYDGEETVDADTYEFQAFDLVLLPACEDARLRLAESFDVKKLKFRKELKEAFENATDEQKKIMMDTLNNLDIDYTSEKSVNKDDNSDTDKAAEDNGAKMLQEFQESIKAQQELEGIVQSLQEKLSVCYTKETRYVEALSRAKDENARLKSDNNKLKAEIGTLTESLTAEKNNATAKQQATTNAVSPERPPCATPDALSTYVVVVEVPKHAPTVVAIASAINASFKRSILPFSSTKLAFVQTPIKVPTVSNISINRKVNTTTAISSVKIFSHSNWQKIGAID